MVASLSNRQYFNHQRLVKLGTVRLIRCGGRYIKLSGSTAPEISGPCSFANHLLCVLVILLSITLVQFSFIPTAKMSPRFRLILYSCFLSYVFSTPEDVERPLVRRAGMPARYYPRTAPNSTQVSGRGTGTETGSISSSNIITSIIPPGNLSTVPETSFTTPLPTAAGAPSSISGASHSSKTSSAKLVAKSSSELFQSTGARLTSGFSLGSGTSLSNGSSTILGIGAFTTLSTFTTSSIVVSVVSIISVSINATTYSTTSSSRQSRFDGITSVSIAAMSSMTPASSRTITPGPSLSFIPTATSTINPSGTLASSSVDALQSQLSDLYPVIQDWIDDNDSDHQEAVMLNIDKIKPFAENLIDQLGGDSKTLPSCNKGLKRNVIGTLLNIVGSTLSCLQNTEQDLLVCHIHPSDSLYLY